MGRRLYGQRGGLYPGYPPRRISGGDWQLPAMRPDRRRSSCSTRHIERRGFSGFNAGNWRPVKSGFVELVDGAGPAGMRRGSAASPVLAARRLAAQRVQLVPGTGSSRLAQAGDHGRHPPVPAGRAGSPREPEGDRPHPQGERFVNLRLIYLSSRTHAGYPITARSSRAAGVRQCIRRAVAHT